jgi:AcrR family transcriptional regulator
LKREQKLAYSLGLGYSHPERWLMALRHAPKPKKTPRQSRSSATFDAIVDSGARILREDGYGALTTNRVAELAGVSVGSLYQYFPNKEAILVELVRRHLVDLEAGIVAIAARAEMLTLEELVSALIEDNARAHLVDPMLHKVLFEEAPRLGALDWRDVFAEGAVAAVVRLLDRHRDMIVAADLPLAAQIVAESVEAIMHGAATRADPRLASGEIARETTRLVLRYLTTRP